MGCAKSKSNVNGTSVDLNLSDRFNDCARVTTNRLINHTKNFFCFSKKKFRWKSFAVCHSRKPAAKEICAKNYASDLKKFPHTSTWHNFVVRRIPREIPSVREPQRAALKKRSQVETKPKVFFLSCRVHDQ